MNAFPAALAALALSTGHAFGKTGRTYYDDAMLASKKLKRLDIDHRSVEMKWVIDFCAQALRRHVVWRTFCAG